MQSNMLWSMECFNMFHYLEKKNPALFWQSEAFLQQTGLI